MFQEELGLEFTKLGKEIKEWTKNNIDNDFEFRENQFEIIYSIISNVIDKEDSKPTHIIEAPTGSGKSLILIICAGVLAEYYDLSSYILCSDLSLWKQYEDFIKGHKKIDDKFGRIKGQSGNNYECLKNKRSVRYGECRLAKISWDKLFNYYKAKQLKFECSSYCPYVKARKKAINSKVTLMTYQLYVRSVGTIKASDSKNPYTFNQRDVLFCDECHNIPNVVQNTFGITVRQKRIEDILTIWKYGISFANSLFGDNKTEKIVKECESLANTEKELNNRFIELFEGLKIENNSEEATYQNLINFSIFIQRIVTIADEIVDMFSGQIQNKEYITKENLIVYEKCEKIIRFANDLSTYLKVFDEDKGVEKKFLVRNIIKNDYDEDEFGRKCIAKYPYSITFGCALENFLVQNYFLNSSEHQIMTSATVGGHKSFIENCGIGAHLYDVLPSTFDYTKSPIYYLSRWKMSKAEKDKNFKYVKSAIYELCTRFKDYKGIIQTWTYDNAKKIFEDAPEEIQERMLLYNGSTAKQELLQFHKKSNKSTILLGPTLNEGIDLPGDECRFIIMMKMPYPYIGDNLVKAKMKLFESWYENETAKTVIQAIGRGNRSEDDWCLTYILDGCFGSLFNKTKDQFPMNIKNRLQFFT
ncbi:MAG: ATP-dependent DNA helicase [Erysipelotrichales bacterium]|nr:ATP-dependent DNA helicase [Erysipelotrichales bacterium]